MFQRPGMKLLKCLALHSISRRFRRASCVSKTTNLVGTGRKQIKRGVRFMIHAADENAAVSRCSYGVPALGR
jgi:hypothetical protein